MADTPPTLMDTMSKVYDEVATQEATDAPDNAGEVGRERDDAGPSLEPAQEQTAAERARDEAGRFAKEGKPRETLTLKGKPDAAPKQERQEPAKQTLEATGDRAPATKDTGGATNVQTNSISPPAHWKGAAKVDWNKLPAPVRESIAADYKQVEAAAPIRQVLAPYEQRFLQEFGGTDRGLQAIMTTWQFARQNPLDFVKQFIQQYQIDPHALGAGNNGQQPVQANQGQEQFADPVIAQLYERQQRLDTALQHIAQQPVLHQQQQIGSEIQSFQTAVKPDGNAEHPYFNDVRLHMAALMQTPGGPQSLKDAYDQACWANPSVRAAMLKETDAARDTERRQAIARAQGAAVSVNGAPGVNGSQSPASKSVLDTLHRVYAAAEGGRA